MQSLYVSILTYMDTIKIQVIGQKALIDVNMLCKCLTEAFEEIRRLPPTVNRCERENIYRDMGMQFFSSLECRRNPRF
jgi:hypothetical protein